MYIYLSQLSKLESGFCGAYKPLQGMGIYLFCFYCPSIDLLWYS